MRMTRTYKTNRTEINNDLEVGQLATELLDGLCISQSNNNHGIILMASMLNELRRVDVVAAKVSSA